MGEAMRSRSELFNHQLRTIEKIKEARQVGAFIPMGRGKTASALTAVLDLGVKSTLVVAPAMVVAARVWDREREVWDHLHRLKVVTLDGIPERRRWRLENLGADINVISYDLFPWLTDQLDLGTRYDAIIFDELSKMKTPGSTRFKRMRTRSMEIPIRIGLTGTPKGNHLADLWGEMFAVAGEKPLGPSKVQFMMQYFTAIPVSEHVATWVPNYGASDIIHEKIKPWAFTLKDDGSVKIPPVRVNPIRVQVDKAVAKLSEDLASEMRVWLKSGAELIALSSGTRAAKVRQMAGGAVYIDNGSWEHVHDHKLDAVQEVLDEQQGDPVLLFYWYKHELERLKARFPQAREVNAESIDAWNRGEVELLLAHPASAGHGLNLQHGGSHVLWFTLPWSWELFSQACARLARPGQTAAEVMAHVLLAGEVDEVVLSVLREKEEEERRLLEAVTI